MTDSKDEKKEDTMVPLGGLWMNESAAGVKYLSGNFTYGSKLLVFPNKYKEGNDKAPETQKADLRRDCVSWTFRAQPAELYMGKNRYDR